MELLMLTCRARLFALLVMVVAGTSTALADVQSVIRRVVAYGKTVVLGSAYTVQSNCSTEGVSTIYTTTQPRGGDVWSSKGTDTIEFPNQGLPRIAYIGRYRLRARKHVWLKQACAMQTRMNLMFTPHSCMPARTSAKGMPDQSSHR